MFLKIAAVEILHPIETWKLLQAHVKSLKKKPKKDFIFIVIGKKPATLLKQELIYSYFPKILIRFPEHLLFRTPLNNSELL